MLPLRNGGRVSGMRRTALLLASTALAVLLACGVVLIKAETPAQAASPGINGEIAFFASDGGGDFEIYAINPNGGSARKLTDNLTNDWSPAWSPDGSKIAFVRQVTSDYTQVFVMNADGTNQIGLGSATGTGALEPTWSPDGKRIAFGGVCTINADGTDRTCPTNLRGWSPAWSPEGKIGFIRGAGFYEIYAANPDGTGLVNLSAADGTGTAPSSTALDWSPDGGRIVFETVSAGLHTMDSNGLNRKPLGGLSGENPTWSPDGQKIAYDASGDNIYVVNIDAPTNTISHLTEGLDPDWQPVDNTPPAGTVLINGDKLRTTSRVVTLRLRATDPIPGSGVASMRLKNAGGSWTTWQPYADSKNWKLTRGAGKKTVYAQYRDAADNVSALAADSITYRP